MLVVVEDGDLHLLAQLALDVEALGGLDVFQVDAAQGGFQCADDLDQLVGVTLGQLDVEHVDAGKLLEQAALAFHHRLAGQRADVAQAQHGGAVGDHAHQVTARGVFGGLGGIGLDVQARIGHARRIGQRQVTLVGQRLGGTDGDLARRRLGMVFPRGIAQGGFGSRELLGHEICIGLRGRQNTEDYTLHGSVGHKAEGASWGGCVFHPGILSGCACAARGSRGTVAALIAGVSLGL